MSTPDRASVSSQLGTYPSHNAAGEAASSSRKRCDEQLPVCSNCQRAGAECDKAGVASQTLPNAAQLEYTHALENRVAQLEALLAERHAVRDDGGGGAQFLPPSPTSQGPLSSFQSRLADNDGERRQDMSALSEVVGIISQGNFEAPAYVGPSAGLSLAVNLGEMVQATVWKKAIRDAPSPGASSVCQSQIYRNGVRPMTMTRDDLPRHSLEEPPSDALGKLMLGSYLKHMHMRYPFLDPAELWRLQRQRTPVAASAIGSLSMDQRYGIFKLYMVFAIGATILQLTGKEPAIAPEEYYMTALRHTAAAEEPRTMRNIEAMTLLAVYHLRSASGLGMWYITGLAMRTCVDLGMHRKAYEQGFSPAVVHHRRRLFWSVHSLEHTVALSLGRPLSISDKQIDVDFPDRAYPVTPVGGGAAPDAHGPNGFEDLDDANGHENIQLGIFLCSLRRIESRIHHSIYRPDKPLSALRLKVDPLFEKLETWRLEVTNAYGSDQHFPEYLLLHYYRAVRTLLQPFLNVLPVLDPYYGLCLRAAGGICQLHKRLHQNQGYGHSFIAVQTVFVAGATLLYALWTQTDLVWSVTLADDLRACSLVLFVMSERAPWVCKYRDAFEVLVASAMEKLRKSESGLEQQQQPQHDMTGAQPPPFRPQDQPNGSAGSGGVPAMDDSGITTMRASVAANNPGPVNLFYGNDMVNRDDQDVWTLVTELANWIDQDREMAPIWMPNFETLQSLPYGDPR
ncbi:Transcription factor [Niveomyces insectorum RCEF 264]|uniref:Transcription factor n=1 Tax=Niveomyces insectorum RCEF 264 TaxID=1081102 RepID=A0A167Q810_9HYPO|nr:Transcription factor [Niveomyces insectorum RCEF 264]